MSNETKVITTKLEDKKDYPSDYSDCKPEEIQNIKEMEKIVAEVESPAITEVLNNLTFKTDIDKNVFERLPLTTNQKDTELIKGKLPENHGINPKK
jgi:hypothetical protein